MQRVKYRKAIAQPWKRRERKTPTKPIPSQLDMSEFRTGSALLLACTILIHSVQALAAERAEAKPLPPTLMRAEFRECMRRSDGLIARTDALDGAKQVHQADLAAVTEEAQLLSERLRGLNPTNEFAVKGYNERVHAFNDKVKTVNEHANGLKALDVALQSDEADYMAECLKPVRLADKEAVLKELGRTTEQEKARRARYPSTDI